VYRFLVGIPKGKRPLVKPRRSWLDNIRMDLWEEGVYIFLVGNQEGKSPQESPRLRWVYNISMDLSEEV
jgi:hypothetical protein